MQILLGDYMEATPEKPFVADTLKPKYDEAYKKYTLEKFLSTRGEQVLMWKRKYLNQQPPFYFDEKSGKWVWVNRKARRKMMRG